MYIILISKCILKTKKKEKKLHNKHNKEKTCGNVLSYKQLIIIKYR